MPDQADPNAPNNIRAAYAQFVREHEKALVASATHWVGFYNLAETAANVVVVAMEKVWRRWNHIREGCHLAYARRCVMTCAIDFARRKTEHETDDGLATLVAPPVLGGNPFPEVGRLIATLSADQSDVLFRHYVMGEQFEEIAEELGRSANTIRGWHRQALEAMRKAMGVPKKIKREES